MGLQLDQVVPWGRSLTEYLQMFNLGSPEELLGLQILDCGGGPASFTAEMVHRGGAVIACDPLYHFSAPQIRERIEATYAVLIAGIKANRANYLWTQIPSPDHLGQIRMQAMEIFLTDFAATPPYYRAGQLPILPFETQQFDLALCSHLLFTYSQALSLEFHIQSLLELCRVAQEVRIFPLLTLAGDPSPHLEPALAQLQSQGMTCQIETVPYEFQRGGNQQLRFL